MDKIDHCDSDDPSHCKWENFSLCSTHKNQSILNLELLETKKVLYLPSDFKSKVKESIASRLATISSGITKLEEKKNFYMSQIEAFHLTASEKLKNLEEFYQNLQKQCDFEVENKQFLDFEKMTNNEFLLDMDSDTFDIQKFFTRELFIEKPKNEIFSFEPNQVLDSNYELHIQGHTNHVTAVVLTNDNKYIISASKDLTIRM